MSVHLNKNPVTTAKHMKTAVRYTFLCLITLAVLGALLRALPFITAPGFSFENLRHAHSHLAFLGWVYPALFLGIVHFFLPSGTFEKPEFKRLFWWSMVVVAIMTIAFALTGYGPVSISLLILHTVLAFFFLRVFIKNWQRSRALLSGRFLITAFICFIVSSFGPIAIPYVQFGTEDSFYWMKYAVHFYLYFQYGGWFLFGVLAILLKSIEKEGFYFPSIRISRAWFFLVVGLLPLYFLGTPVFGESPGLRTIVLAAALLSGLGIYYFIRDVYPDLPGKGFSGLLIHLVLIFFASKNIMEILASSPIITNVTAYLNHFMVLTYLHWFLLGFVTIFFLWMFGEMGFGQDSSRLKWVGLAVFGLGFLCTEFYLFSMALNSPLPNFNEGVLFGSLLMMLGLIILSLPYLSLKKRSSI